MTMILRQQDQNMRYIHQNREKITKLNLILVLAIYMTLTEISMIVQSRNKMPRKIRSDKKVNEVKYKGLPPQPELNKKRPPSIYRLF
jgi:hypothetical protein